MTPAASAVGAAPMYLPRASVPVESEVRWPRGGASLYMRDPDNHSVELITPGLWAIY